MSGEEQHGQFLPLSVAAAIAYGSLVGDNEAARDRARLEAHLNYVAAELASILALFSQIDGAPPEILSPEHVARGKFKLDLRTIFPRQDAELTVAIHALCA